VPALLGLLHVRGAGSRRARSAVLSGHVHSEQMCAAWHRCEQRALRRGRLRCGLLVRRSGALQNGAARLRQGFRSERRRHLLGSVRAGRRVRFGARLRRVHRSARHLRDLFDTARYRAPLRSRAERLRGNADLPLPRQSGVSAAVRELLRLERSAWRELRLSELLR